MILSMACFLGISASARDYDFYEENTFTGENALEEAKKELEMQLERAKELGNSLDACYYLDILEDKSGISTEEDVKEKKVDTSSEKNDVIDLYSGKGYVVEFISMEKEAEVVNYSFEVENGKIILALEDDEEITDYNGKTLEEVLDSFNNLETNDYRVVYSVNINDSKIEESEVLKTYAEVQEKSLELKALGYEVSYKQNNMISSDKRIVSRCERTLEDIITELKRENVNKEIKDVSINKVSEPSTYISKKTTEKNVAEKEKAELEKEGNIYDEVSMKSETVIDKSNATKIQSKVEYNGTVDFDLPHTVENSDGKGYRYYYEVKDVVVTDSESFENNFLTKEECKELKSFYSKKGYITSCTSVTNTTIEEEDNKYYFNLEKDNSMSWVHLDISVNQKINIYDENNKIVDTVTGTLSNLRGVVNEGTFNERKITYNQNASLDGNRYEYTSISSSNFTSNDLITIYGTISYRYNNKTIVKDIVLEGYLKNIFNVCRDKNNSRNRGFDLEIAISVDSTGQHIINFTTSEVYTFTAKKDAVCVDKVYFDEYKYGEKIYYWVEAKDLDYMYDVNYVATDYTLFINGNKSLVNVVKEYYDKYFIITAKKITYIVKTVAMIKEKDKCGIDEIPPHTDVNNDISNINIYSNVVIFDDKKKRII